MSEHVMSQGDGGRHKKSCCLYGCLGLAVVGVLLAVAAGIGGYFVYGKLGDLVEAVTDTEPVALPVVELTPAEQKNLDAKLTALNAALEGPSENKTFELTADELNGLLDSNKELPFGDWVHLSIENGKVTGQVSLPLSETPAAFLGKGRYLNGMGTFDVSIKNGVLRVFLVDATIKGKEIPAEVMQQMGGQNLAQNIKDPKVLALFAKVRDLRVEDDHIVLELQ